MNNEECSEKVSHHELQEARAEQERKINSTGRIIQDAESVRSGNSHVTSQPGVFPNILLLKDY